MLNQRKLLTVVFLLANLLWIGFIFGRSLKTADLSSAESGWFLSLFQRVFPSVTMHFVRKLAHFTEFFLLGAISCGTGVCLFSRRFWCFSLALGAVVAPCDELLQRLSEGRSCQLSDAFLDFSGVLAATAVLALLIWILQKKGKRIC